MSEANQTIEQMWNDFLRQATRNKPGRKIPDAARPAFYAGCHGMLDSMLKMMRAGEADPGAWATVWQKWADELAQYSRDYNEGKV